MDSVVSRVLGKTAVPLGEGYSEERSWKEPARDQLLTNRKARWETGCCHSPYPVLGTSEYLSQVEPFLHNSSRPDCDEKSQHVWTGQLEAHSHPELSCGFAQSQMQSLSHSHKHDPGKYIWYQVPIKLWSFSHCPINLNKITNVSNREKLISIPLSLHCLWHK